MQIFTLLLGAILVVTPLSCSGTVQWSEAPGQNEDSVDESPTGGQQHHEHEHFPNLGQPNPVDSSRQLEDTQNTQTSPQSSQDQQSNLNSNNGNQETPTFSESSSDMHQYHHQQQLPINPIDESGPSGAATKPLESFTIIVLGRSGSGVSSTVPGDESDHEIRMPYPPQSSLALDIKELVGPLSPCQKPNGSETFKNFAEYTISNIPSNDGRDYRIKLLDVPGFIDGRTLEQDGLILAGLKSYINKHRNPTFYLALSRFDDNRIDGEHSLFVQFLKRIQLFQDLLPGAAKDNTLFLLTRLMSETKAIQRRPDSKINDFRRIIQEYTTFGSHSNAPVQVIVGENKAEKEYGAKVENGYYKLPNRQHYPKNIWQALYNMSSTWVEQTQQQSVIPTILTAVMNNREQAMKCDVKLIDNDWEFYDQDSEDYLYLIQRKNITIDTNEINQKIDEVYNTKSEDMKFEGIVQKTSLLGQLQDANITTNSSLPQNLLDNAAFFQQNKISSGIAMFLLNETFGLRMPEYIKSLFVGYGYDLLDDEVSPQTLFRTNILLPNNVGYELPAYIKCRKFTRPENKYFQSYSQTYAEYFQERLNYFDVPGKANISADSFKGKVKEGFNLKPEQGANIVSLSAVKEVRTVKCMLDRIFLKKLFSEEFKIAIDSLTEFNPHDKDSENTWTNFFDRYGSHIVTQAYGGGSIHGSLVGSNVKNVLTSPSTIDETLSAMMKFDKFPVANLESPTYRLYAGDRDPRTAQLYDLDEGTRENLLKIWTQSLKADFDMFSNELDLEPISTIVSLHNQETGVFVENALNLFLEGKLKYERKKKPNDPNKPKRNRNSTSNKPTRRPTQSPPIYTLPTNTPTQPVATPAPSSNTDRFHQTPLGPASTGGYDGSVSNYYNFIRDSNSPQNTYRPSNNGDNNPSYGQHQPQSTFHQSGLPSSYHQPIGTYPSSTGSQSSVPGNPNYNPTSLSTSFNPATGANNQQLPPEVQTFLNQTRQSVDMLNERIEQMRRDGESRHQQQINNLERERDEQLRRMAQRAAENQRVFQESEKTRMAQYQSGFQTLEETARYNAQMAQQQIQEFRRQEAEKQLKHLMFLEALKLKQEEEEAIARAKCSGWRSVLPGCW